MFFYKRGEINQTPAKKSNQKWLLFFCIKSKLEGFKDVFFYVLIRAGALIGCILQVLKKLLNLI